MTRPGITVSGPRRAGLARRKGFVRSEDGSFIIFGLFIFVAMLVAAGMGVDLMRYEAQRARLQATLDRAILAAAALDQTLTPKEVVLDYFAKAGLGDNIDPNDVIVTDTGTSRRVEASASLRVDSTFLRLAGVNYLNAPAQGAAEESASLTEISLVVDVSGSMAWTSYSGRSKLYELKRAANTFANIILCNAADSSNSAVCNIDTNKASISLVPYDGQVMLGTEVSGAFNLTNEHTRSTCVTFYNSDFSTIAVSNTQLLQRTGHFDPVSDRNSSPNRAHWPCKTDATRDVKPFEHSASALRSRINALDAWGATSIEMGMKWGAALLDPAARGAINHLVSRNQVHSQYRDRPLAHDHRGLQKVIVLMTDGENTEHYYLNPGFHSGNSPIWRANDDGYLSVYDAANNRYWWVSQGRWSDHAYGTGTYEECRRRWSWWYGWYDDCSIYWEGSGAQQIPFNQLWDSYTIKWWNQWNWLPAASGRFGYDQKNANLNQVCTLAKNAGVVIFTIGFEVPYNQHEVMRNCASAPSYYYNANGLNISDAFAAIAREISKLRLIN